MSRHALLPVHDEGLSGLPESIEPPQRQRSPVEFVESQIPVRAAFFIRLLLEFSIRVLL